MTLKPTEWVTSCPDCGRRLTLPMERHADCDEVRRWSKRSWSPCNRCGGLNRHTPDCTAQGDTER